MATLEDKRVNAAWNEGFRCGEEDAARRARARIRRAQAGHLKSLRDNIGDELVQTALDRIDAATRAPRKARRR